MAAKVTINTRALARNGLRLKKLSEEAGDRIVKRAISTMKRRVVSAGLREISAQYGVESRLLHGRLSVISKNAGSLTITGSAGGLPLTWFGGTYGGRQSRGASAAVIRGRPTVYESSFIVKGRRQIVERPMTGGWREPRRFVTVWGPGIGRMFREGSLGGVRPVDVVVEVAQGIFSSEIDRLLLVEERRA